MSFAEEPQGIMVNEPDGRAKRQLANPHERGRNKHKRIGAGALAKSRKRGRSATSSREENAGAVRRRPRAEPPKGTPPPQAASTPPPQELAVGEKATPDDSLVGRPQ